MKVSVFPKDSKDMQLAKGLVSGFSLKDSFCTTSDGPAVIGDISENDRPYFANALESYNQSFGGTLTAQYE